MPPIPFLCIALWIILHVASSFVFRHDCRIRQQPTATGTSTLAAVRPRRQDDHPDDLTSRHRLLSEEEDDTRSSRRTSASTRATYSIEYSLNFRRHIVVRRLKERRGPSNYSDECDEEVVESFLWLDQARLAYPQAQIRPLQLPKEFLSSIDTMDCIIAGVSSQELVSYNITAMEESNRNEQLLKDILQSLLKWFPQQIERFLQTACVGNPKQRIANTLSNCYPASVLEERMRFLLAPLPPNNDPIRAYYEDHHPFRDYTLQNDPVDWPVLFYQRGFGAGMTVAQVSHALQTLPLEILSLSGWWGNHNTNMHSHYLSSWSSSPTQLLAFLYEQTPSVVVDMTQQQLDPRLCGVSNTCRVSVAYLHWKGCEWITCRIVMDALHCFSTLSTDFYESRQGKKRKLTSTSYKTSSGKALSFLQMRLQLEPWQLRAMCRTHPNLSKYTVAFLTSSIEQSMARLLGLDSQSIQRLVMQMPSLLGISTDSLHDRVSFWSGQVGVPLQQLRGLLLGEFGPRPQRNRPQPCLLAYSRPNLEAKLRFFRNVLQVQDNVLVGWTTNHPDLWGRSLDQHYKPLISQFCSRCLLQREEFGRMVASRVPQLLKCHWDGNLRIKLDFLQRRVGLSDVELRKVVLTVPVILMYSVQNLESKLEALFGALPRYPSMPKSLITNNPSLLVSSPAALEKRANRAQSRNESLLSAMGGFVVVSATETVDLLSARRRSRPVVLLTTSDVTGNEQIHATSKEFPSVQDAADHAGVSRSSMYRIIRERRQLPDGKRYVYSDTMLDVPQTSIALSERVEKRSDEPGFKVSLPVVGTEAVRPSALVIGTTGRSYPPNSPVRGHRSGGGMALDVPEWSSEQWRKVAERLWRGQESRVRRMKTGCLILGYPYTRPSRRRCSLYVAREALRVAREANSAPSVETREVVIVTDSNYVLDLLQNASRIVTWGESESPSSMQYDVPLQRNQANSDILYPLAKTYSKMVRANWTVKFVSSLEYPQLNYSSLSNGALLAAKHMFELV